MCKWANELKKGKLLLAKHKPDRALVNFDRALEATPPNVRSARASIQYYYALALYKVGRRGEALAYWVESHRNRKSAYSKRMLVRHVNEYGMPRQSGSDRDEWRAFYSIHLARYLQHKKSRRLETRAETDMIRELIEEHWQSLLQMRVLDGCSPDEKLEIFQKTVIVFPFIELPNHLNDSVVHVDFEAKRRLSPSDRCNCGSGLPFKLCCGRTRGEDELLGGNF